MKTTSSLLSVVIWALSACTSPSREPSTHDGHSTSLRSAPARLVNPASNVIEHSAIKMGMPFKIKLYAVKDRLHAREVISDAFEAITVVEDNMSEWKPSSEISQINQKAGKKAVSISSMTFEVLQMAYALAERSQGAFDPTWAAFRGIWSFKSERPTLPSTASIQRAIELVNYRDLELRQSTRSAFLNKSGMEIGLGGIAKGYGIDQAAGVLKRHGYNRFVIDGGGDILVGDPVDKRKPVKIGITHPRLSKTIFATVTAQNEAVVTSGDYEHYFELDGQRYHHIIDVRTGYPAPKAVSVTVVSPTAMIADGLATALFVSGPSKISELLAHYPETKALMLAADGAVYGFPEKFAKAFPKRWRPDKSTETQ